MLLKLTSSIVLKYCPSEDIPLTYEGVYSHIIGNAIFETIVISAKVLRWKP